MIDIQGIPIEIESGRIGSSPYTFVYEDLDEPRLARLREEEGLDAIVAGAETDVEAMARLRHYVRTLWQHTHPDPPPPADALELLHHIRKGKTGGFCGNFTTVYVQCCAAMGLHARQISVKWEDGGGHSVAEVWSDDLGRWALMDTDSDYHYLRDGIPLNALDLHRAWVERDTGEIQRVEGGECHYASDIIGMYYFFGVRMANNLMTGARPGAPRPPVPSLDWVDGLTPPRNPDRDCTDRPEDLYWTLNQTEVALEPTGDPGRIRLRLKTFCPGFQDFRVHLNGRGATSVPAAFREGHVAYGRFDWDADAGPVAVCARNVRGVCGQPAKASRATG